MRSGCGTSVRDTSCSFRFPARTGFPHRTSFVEAFHRRYERAYGYRDADSPVEVVTWHASLFRPGRAGARREMPEAAPAAPLVQGRRLVFFPETDSVEVSVYDRESLCPGDRFDGPCLVAEPTTTTVVLPDDRVEVEARM